MDKKSRKQLEQEHGEISIKAEEISKKNQNTILNRFIRALPFGFEIVIVAIVIPILIRDLTGIDIIWPGIVVVLSNHPGISSRPDRFRSSPNKGIA